MTHLTLTIVAFAFAFTAPPILPFTELNDKKIEVALAHMVKADECTPQDMNVLMQLDHIHWKYAQMRQVFYKVSQEAADGSVISSKVTLLGIGCFGGVQVLVDGQWMDTVTLCLGGPVGWCFCDRRRWWTDW